MYGVTTYQAELQTTASLTDNHVKDFLSFIDVSEKTAETYFKALRQFFNYLYVNGITQPCREDVIAYRDSLKETLKANTVQLYITALRLFFAYTEERQLYPNIANKVKGAKIDRDFKKDYLTIPQVRELLQNVDRTTATGKRDYAVLLLMTVCGLRTIEISRACVEDLRTRAGNTVLYVQGKGKQDKANFVIIPAQVEKAIRDYQTTAPATAPTSPLFISTSNNSKGKALTTRSISGIAKEHLKKIGIDSDRITAHSLRHTAITLSILNGESLEHTSQFARHNNIATTMLYNHALQQDNNSCSCTVADAIL